MATVFAHARMYTGDVIKVATLCAIWRSARVSFILRCFRPSGS